MDAAVYNAARFFDYLRHHNRNLRAGIVYFKTKKDAVAKRSLDAALIDITQLKNRKCAKNGCFGSRFHFNSYKMVTIL